MNAWWVVDFISHTLNRQVNTKTFDPLCKTSKFDDIKSQNLTSNCTLKTFVLQIVHSQYNINTLYYITRYTVSPHRIKSNILCLFM